MIEAVLLDVGGVFFVPEHEPFMTVLGPYGLELTSDVLDRSHYAGVAAFDRSGATDWRNYHRGLVESCGLDGPDGLAAADEVRLLMDAVAWRRLLPGSLEGLRRLADTGVRLGIVSNSNGTVEAQLLASGVCQTGPGEGVEVGVVIDSHVVGIEKPDPRIFALALDELGVDPGHTVHVGDTVAADIAGARAAGIEPLHLDPHGFCALDDHEHVRSLDDVVVHVLKSRP